MEQVERLGSGERTNTIVGSGQIMSEHLGCHLRDGALESGSTTCTGRLNTVVAGNGRLMNSKDSGQSNLSWTMSKRENDADDYGRDGFMTSSDTKQSIYISETYVRDDEQHRN